MLTDGAPSLSKETMTSTPKFSQTAKMTRRIVLSKALPRPRGATAIGVTVEAISTLRSDSFGFSQLPQRARLCALLDPEDAAGPRARMSIPSPQPGHSRARHRDGSTPGGAGVLNLPQRRGTLLHATGQVRELRSRMRAQRGISAVVPPVSHRFCRSEMKTPGCGWRRRKKNRGQSPSSARAISS
jgi:hypothetical protein